MTDPTPSGPEHGSGGLTAAAIRMTGVRKSFGKKVAVEGIDLHVPMGGMVGLIGPNGAGKTTSIRMVMSILFPDAGQLEVLGRKSAVESKDRIGYLPEERGVYKKMKVGGFLKYMSRLKGVSPRGLDTKIDAWLERIDLAGVKNKRCEELSKGMQQKVQFVATVLHEPDLIILDEPFSGLDPVNMRLLRELIEAEHARGATVVFSTHVMIHAEQICDHIVMIHNGRKVLDGTMDEIRAGHDTRTIQFEPLDPAFTGDAARGVEGIDRIEHVNGTWEAALADSADPSAVLGAVASRVPVSRIELHRPSLEDIFIQIVAGGDTHGQEAEQLRAAVQAGGAAAAEDDQ